MATEIINPTIPVEPIPQPDPVKPFHYELPSDPLPFADFEFGTMPPWQWALQLYWARYGREVIKAVIIVVVTAIILLILYYRK